MSMKTSVVIADGTFPTATAPLLGSVESVFAQAAELGYDAVSVTVNHPDDVEVEAILAAMDQYGVKVSGLATGRICGADGFSISSANEANRTEAVNRMLGHLEICKKLDAKLIIGTVRGSRRPRNLRKPVPQEHDRYSGESRAAGRKSHVGSHERTGRRHLSDHG